MNIFLKVIWDYTCGIGTLCCGIWLAKMSMTVTVWRGKGSLLLLDVRNKAARHNVNQWGGCYCVILQCILRCSLAPRSLACARERVWRYVSHQLGWLRGKILSILILRVNIEHLHKDCSSTIRAKYQVLTTQSVILMLESSNLSVTFAFMLFL